MASFSGGRIRKGAFILFRLIFTIILIISCPVILGAWGLLALYRTLIRRIALHRDPTLGGMVSSISNFFAAHDIYGNSYTTNIALHVVGKIDRHHLIHGFQKLLETSKNSDGSPQYPELTQRIVKRYGYTFWKNVEFFNVGDHIKYVNELDPDTSMTLEEIRQLIAKFGKTPLESSRSPWIVYVVKNLVSESDPKVKSAIVLRLHHCMFDGQSVLNVFSKMADNAPLQLPWKNMMRETEAVGVVNILKKVILRPLVIALRGPYELVGQLMSYDNNELIKESKRNFKGVMRFHECEAIQLSDLKTIKNHFGVSMSALLTTLCARALKKFMESRGIKEDKVHMTFPLPVLSHPDKLRNYFSGGIISFDFSHDNRVRLLMIVERKFYEFKYALASGLPEASMLLLKIIGSLPCFLLPRIDNLALSCTMMNSVIPGPIGTGYYCGFPIVDATVAGSISRSYPIGTLSFSYRGYYKFGWSGDTSIMKSQDDIQELGNAVLEELQEFQRIMDDKSNIV